jgi:hypothetical protein
MKNSKLLIVTGKEPSIDERLGFKIERSKALNAISLSGAKVSHDSGGRFIVIEIPEEAEQDIIKRLPGARLVPLDSDVTNLISNLDSTESLFLNALKIRTSKKYRDAKKKRKVGDTPEEKELISAPDVREEY